MFRDWYRAGPVFECLVRAAVIRAKIHFQLIFKQKHCYNNALIVDSHFSVRGTYCGS